MAVFKTLDSLGGNSTLNKRKFADVGEAGGSFSKRTKALNSSTCIVNSLKSYSAYLDSVGIGYAILVEVDEDNLFYINRIYFRFAEGHDDLEICINICDSLILRVLVNIYKTKDSVPMLDKYLKVYESYWSELLNIKLQELDLDYLCV